LGLFFLRDACLPLRGKLRSAFCPSLSAIKVLADPCPLSGKTGPCGKTNPNQPAWIKPLAMKYLAFG